MRGLTPWLLVLLTVLAAEQGQTKSARVVCYYTNWSIYRPGTAKFSPQNINPYLCTHLIYAFGGFTKENTLKPFDKYQDIEKGGYSKFTGLKSYNKNLKTMIAIGGWNEGSSRFSGLVASPERRREFVKNSIKFLRQNKFDGLDLDWEYPAFRDGGKPKDRPNYAKLVQELREEFEKESQATGRSRLLLTMAVPAGIEYIDKGYDIPKLNRYLDWMNILSYDYHSAFEPSVNHHSPLFALEAASEYNYDSELNIDFTIKHYLEAGADPDKLVLGIPTYGRSFTLFNPDTTDIGAPADGPGEQGDATREKGYLAYYEICESLMPKSRKKRETEDSDEYEDEEEEEWVIVQPNARAMGPYAYKGNQWVGYDDIDIVKKKAQYVAENSLGGIMFWSIDNDDFRGKCHEKPYPLIEAAKSALYDSLGLKDVIPVSKKPQSTRKRTRPSKPSKTQTIEIEDKETNSLKSSKKRNRIESDSSAESKSTSKSGGRRQNSVRRGSSTESTPTSNTPAWGLNTPEPPTTPDPGTDFKCEEEGFFPHPRDCKKYFWCLESGPSNLGIVAHQFTCPSGLYFNKAADSCDFARNVLCNTKKTTVTSAPPSSTTAKIEAEAATKSYTTSTTTERYYSSRPSSLSALFTTRRPSLRITAATSSTTLLTKTSTTPQPLNDDEDEDEDEISDAIDDLSGLQDTEEDPKVIKELVDLIKKLGGVEQLEKYLSGASSNTGQSSQSSQGSQTTTPATIKRLLYERVLSKARPQNERAPFQQNSRGPQTAGLVSSDEKKSSGRRERPQYTTINRKRQSTTTTEESVSDERGDSTEEREEVASFSSTTSRSGLPQYVNIRRARPSTTEEPEAPSRLQSEEDDEEEEEEEEQNDDRNKVQSVEYSTVRRKRPDYNEVTTSKYKTIQRVRSTTTSSPTSESETTPPSRQRSTTQSSTSYSPTLLNTKSITETTLPNTQAPETDVTTVQDDVTIVNDVSVAGVTSSFASENGVIANVGSSTILNAQITTLSNTPKSTDDDDTTPSTIPVSYSTQVTISEDPTTQRTTLFAKRTRPTTTTTTTTTTTAKPQDLIENKVSFDRKYTSIKRTYTPASSPSSLSNTSSRARLRNEISALDDDGAEKSDSELVETSVKDSKTRVGIRRIRSTTPASQENQDNSDYGAKRFVRPGRFNTRRLSQAVSEEVSEANVENSSPVTSNGENGLVSRNRLSSFGTNRLRKFQPSSRTTNIDNEGSGNEFVKKTEFVSTTNAPRSTPNRRFRPSLSNFEAADLSSLTALDNSRIRNENIGSVRFGTSGNRNAQVARRFRPTFSTFVTDDSNDDLVTSTTQSNVDRQRLLSARRSSRFTTLPPTTDDDDFELNTEASEASLIPRGRKINIARFSPRPFAVSSTNIVEYDAYSQKENELNVEVGNDSKLVAKTRLSAPVINVSEEQKSGLKQAINVTKVINSNLLLGQSNNRSGLLILRRPSKPFQSTTLPYDEGDSTKTTKGDSLENIHLSETNIEEKEHDDDDSNDLAPERPRKRIIVKKLRSTTTALDASTTEATTPIEKSNDIEEKEKDESSTVKPRVRKIIRKRPSSTTAEEATTTEKYVEEKADSNSVKASDLTTVTPKSRKVVIRRKLKPIVTDEGRTRLFAEVTKAEAEEQLNNISNSEALTESTSELPLTTEYVSPTTEESVQIDLLAEQTTALPTSTKAKSERPPYRPNKRPLTILTSTEPTTTVSKVYSRKYNNGVFTTPLTPAEREQQARRPILGSRPVIRRPFTTARTTTTDEEEYESEEEPEEEEPDSGLVFVPADQLFTRGPPSTARKTSSQPDVVEDGDDDDDEDLESEEDEEEKEPEKQEEVKPVIQPKPGSRFTNRFNPSQRPPPGPVRLGNSNGREPNRPPLPTGNRAPNRPAIGNRPANKPVAFQPNQNRPRFGPGASPVDSTTKGYTRKYVANKPVVEAGPTTEEINLEAVKAKHDQLFANPKRPTTTTSAPTVEDSTTDIGDMTTDVGDMMTTMEADTDMNLFSTTEESTTVFEMPASMDDVMTTDRSENEITTFDSTMDSTESLILSSSTTSTTTVGDDSQNVTTTEKHHVFALSEYTANSTTPKTVEDNTVYPIFSLLTTARPENKTRLVSNGTEEQIIKTSSQLDRLFSVSRVVEVTSSQEKHRFNKKNESRLIERTERKQEQKPTLDKIGEVSRYTLIKIVEGDIPIYLTNLSHEYPVANPPFNPIRIDEGRNAKTLMNFTDSGKENLIASETVNSAYNHRNTFIDIIDAPTFSEIQRQSLLRQNNVERSIKIEEQDVEKEDKNSEKEDKNNETEDKTTERVEKEEKQIFVPGAVVLNEEDKVTPKSNSEYSTLALEGLFMTGDSNAQATGSNHATGSQPFVVYAAPKKNESTVAEEQSIDKVPSGRSIDNIVKIQVIRPDLEASVKTYAKGEEFFGVPAAVDVLLEKEHPVAVTPFKISILNQDNETTTSSTTAEPIVISIANLDSVILKKAEDVSNDTTTTTSTTTTTQAAVDNSTVQVENITLTTTEASTTAVPDSQIVDVKPVAITNSTLSNIAKKRPKLTFPRRPQTNQLLKTSNVTRITVQPSTNQTSTTKTSKLTSANLNVPFTTPKYNRTNSYTSGRSRFSSVRSQNVPVDTRKQKVETNRAKPNATVTDTVRTSTYDPSKKITIKPFRPSLRPTFSPRRTTQAPAQVSEA
ncbi:uncharacterized protein LOC143919933 isoform X2 [Arctopsyche grandis]|uniref:uncharacterized protein LOC143919933 isoform X2 n=1 Tax=Arctopsyche grandis TaxID=121162 RepID=UPI00406D7F91